MSLCCNEMIEDWESNFVGEKKSHELDVAHAFKILSSDVIARTAFGSNYNEGKQIFEYERELGEYTAQILFSVYIPGWRFVPTKINRRMHQINNKLGSLASLVIEKRRKLFSEGEIAGDDLLSILLKSSQSQVRESGNKDDAGMSIDEIVQECRLFFFAGQEATADLLMWTMILLSIHQDWQTKAREEILQVFGKNMIGHAGIYEKISNLPIVTMILFEVLRLYPPASIIARLIDKDTCLGGMNLPAGTTFSLPILLIHRDPNLWGDNANEFKPERFSEGVTKATKGKLMYFPFGWGPRICIGRNFGLMETKLAIAMTLQRFSFDLSPSYSHAPTMLVTLQPQYGAPLVIHKL